ncbi:MAG: hypothetical protein ACP5JH_00075 [Bacteroidota bacterium]
MSQEIQKLPEQVPVQPTPSELTLADLMKLVEPLLKLWTQNDNEKHRRELEYETALLQAMSRQNRLTTIGVFAIAVLLLVICGVLFYLGRDSTAMDLIKLVVGLGGALLGGYGFGMRRRQLENNQE